MLTIVSGASYICAAKSAHNQDLRKKTINLKTISHVF